MVANLCFYLGWDRGLALLGVGDWAGVGLGCGAGAGAGLGAARGLGGAGTP